ncbi:MAG: hypothetical protein EXR72_06405 [Myxococcales bacterium]|nr:hypothetical protein [Myxococcales bacterium]
MDYRKTLFFPALLPALFALGCAGAGNGSSRDSAAAGSDDGGGTPQDLAGSTKDLAQAQVDQAKAGVDMTAPADLAMADLVAPPDLIDPGKTPGENCALDADCASKLCKAVVAGSNQKVCVAPCKSQADCVKWLDLFCEAITPGSPDGYCIPRSPAHCTSCGKDIDCGSLAERCMQAPDDIAPACHVDCALAGAAACPPDYACVDVVDGNMARKLCVPQFQGKNAVCLDSLGGFCDRVTAPQPCARTNAAGTCTGQRVCIMNTRRYDKCGALAPQFKKSCLDLDPAGCMLAFAPNVASDKLNCGMCGKACANGEDCCNMACTKLDGANNCGACGKTCGMGLGCCNGGCAALSDVNNCGACGMKCPGIGSAGAEVACNSEKCVFTCKGENYDVDGKEATGCEQNHGASPGHTEATAPKLGSVGCDDSTNTTFNGKLFSDGRLHQNPPIDAFDNTVGSAPDFWSIIGTGKSQFDPLPCVNNYNVTITTAGGTQNPCYKVTLKTDKVTNNVTVSGSGTASMSTNNFTQYSNNSTLYFKIEKVCDLKTQEAITYQVKFSL